MHRVLTIAAMAAAAMPLGACGDRGGSTRSGENAVAGALPAEGTVAGFAARQTVIDLYEIAAGQLALERATRPEVRRFAEAMVSAHQRTRAELEAELARSRLNVRTPDEPDPRRGELIADLRSAPAAEFEGRYIDQQLEAHTNAVLLLQQYAETGKAPALKDWARRTAPVVENHWRMASALDQRLKAGDSAQGGAAGGQRR